MPEPDDLELLQDFRSQYDPAMAEVGRIVREELGVPATARLKTINTIIDKLRRERTRLSSMQDIAGLRIVRDFDRLGQNALTARLVQRFPGSRVDDRRQRPKHGYRAVHVIVPWQGRQVEIQVRTRLQDRWAQLVEKLGDVWGRDIRYGGLPNDPDTRVGSMTRREIVDAVKGGLSDVISMAEEHEASLNAPPGAANEERLREHIKRFQAVQKNVESILQGLTESLAGG